MKTIPLKGKYPEQSTEYITNKSFDEVWDNVVDLFAKTGIPIKTIDKSSGIIVANKTNFQATFENENGALIDTNAAFVAVKLIVPANNRLIEPVYVSSDFNVRVKKLADNKVSIGINVFINKAEYYWMAAPTPTIFNGRVASTGKLERTIYGLVK
jgi:hypothetical protein